MRRSSPFWAILVFLFLLPATGCLLRNRPVEDRLSTAPLKEASQQGLIDAVSQQAEKIRSLQATVDIDTTAGGVKKGHYTDYKEIRGYVLVRKPGMLRMIGLLPIVRTTAFDMVSNGQEFKLSIPPKNRFVMGRNEVQAFNPEQPMENIRPQNIYDALLVLPIDPESEMAVRENGNEILHDAKGHRILQPDYELTVIRRKEGDGAVLTRKIIFSRTDLRAHRQLIYDEDGNVVTDARYAEYKDYDGVSFPSRIEIVRPREEYDITLNILKLDLNKQLRDDQFVLEQPAGADVIHMDGPQSSAVQVPGIESAR